VRRAETLEASADGFLGAWGAVDYPARMQRAREMGLVTVVALVVANMVGAGVFTTSGFALADLGEPRYVLWAWAVGGAVALCGALSYAGLTRRFPESGGEYWFLSRCFGPLLGFLAGWVSLLAGFSAPIAVSALALEAYLGPLVGLEGGGKWLASAAVVFAFAAHGLWRREGLWLQNAAVALKLVLLVGFVALGAAQLPELEPASATRGAPLDWGAFAVTLVWISFSYSGWNATSYVAGEVRDPRRTAGRSLWLGCAVVALVYLGLNLVFLGAAPREELAGRPDVALVAARALGGEALGRVVSGLVALALYTSISAMMLAGPRVYSRMAQDGLFPARLAFRGEVPLAAVAFQAAVALVIVWWSDLQELLGYVGFTLSLSSAAAVLGLLRLRLREGAAAVPVPGFPLTPLVYLVVTSWCAVYLVRREPDSALLGLATAALGLPIYALFRWRARRTT
jgi:amino acid transporter